MEYVLFAVLMTIAVFYLIYLYFGTIGVVLVIAALVFGVGCFDYYLRQEDKKEEEKRVNSSYVQTAKKFIQFYRLLPRRSFMVSTPQYLGIRVFDDSLGVRIKIYLDGAISAEEQQIQKRSLEDAIRALLGENAAEGMELYRTLGLDVKLHNNDDDYPVILMWLYSSDRYKDIEYLMKWYQNTYGEKLTIAPYDDY